MAEVHQQFGGAMDKHLFDSLSRVDSVMANVELLMKKPARFRQAHQATNVSTGFCISSSTSCARCDNLQKQVDELKLVQNGLSTPIVTFCTSCEDLQKQVDGLKLAQTERSTPASASCMRCDDFHKEVEELKVALRAAVEGRCQVEGARDALEQHYQEKLQVLQGEKESTQEEVATLSAERTVWQSDRAALVDEVAALRQECAQHTMAVATLRAARQELDASRCEAERTEHELSTTILELEQTEQRWHDLETVHRETLARYRQEMAERKRCYNMLQELRGNIRVICRVRPVLPVDPADCVFNPKFPDHTDAVVSLFEQRKGAERSYVKEHKFEFDRVFSDASTHKEVFAEVEPVVTSVMDGFNACIFAYGQTGSGKTYTMEGTKPDGGLYRRTLASLFGLREARRGVWDYRISVGVVEVYNEAAFDLLNNDRRNTPLEVRQMPNKKIAIDNTVVEVGTAEDVLRVLEKGHRNRSVGQTDLNLHSSRSHCLLTVHVEGYSELARERVSGKLHLVDLAGSEKASKSNANGGHQVEANYINKSLSALGDVIRALGNKDKHTPYRNSHLTFVLSDSLGGDSKVMMIANVNPSSTHVPESLATLNFAAAARRVELGRAKKNVQRL